MTVEAIFKSESDISVTRDAAQRTLNWLSHKNTKAPLVSLALLSQLAIAVANLAEQEMESSAQRIKQPAPNDLWCEGCSPEDCSGCGIPAKQNPRPDESSAVGAKLSDVTVLPDGSAFFTASLPLPKDHWLFAEYIYEDGDSYDPKELPKPLLTHVSRGYVEAAVRYAIRAATMRGQDMDFDPDALVQNAIYALCGPFTKSVAHTH